MSDIQEEQKRLYKRAEENDIKLLQEENKKLKELCDKYEEEHKTTFEEWKKDINIIDEFEEELEREIKTGYSFTKEDDNYNEAIIIRQTLETALKRLNELKGDNK